MARRRAAAAEAPKNGRPPLLLSDEGRAKADGFLASIRATLPIAEAARANGIDPDTVYDWLAKAKLPGAAKHIVKFSDDYARATAFAENAMAQYCWALGSQKIDKVPGKVPPDGHLLLKMLARRHPERWAERTKHEMSGPEGKPLRGVQIYLPAIRRTEDRDDDLEA